MGKLLSLITALATPTSRDEFLSTFVRHLRFGKADILYGSKNWNKAMASNTVDDADPDEANLVTSRYKGEGIETHALLIDLDIEHVYVPSSTGGHGHLYVKTTMGRGQWQSLMAALCKAGVISDGYYSASINRGFSSLRPPWVKKEADFTLEDLF